MKIVSPDILHKSDAGGVKVNIKDEAGVREAFNTILKNAKAYKADADIHGIAIQEMAPWGTEVILGSVNDPYLWTHRDVWSGWHLRGSPQGCYFPCHPCFEDQKPDEMLGEITAPPSWPVFAAKPPVTARPWRTRSSNYSTMILDLRMKSPNQMPTRCWFTKKAKGFKVVDARIILKKNKFIRFSKRATVCLGSGSFFILCIIVPAPTQGVPS